MNWSRVSDRIFIWDYITSFANYIIPFPNWFVLGVENDCLSHLYALLN